MISLIPIKINVYSGEKSTEEYPRSFMVEDVEVEIVEVIDRWYQADSMPDYPVSDYFKVRSTDGSEFLLKHELNDDIWYLCRHVE
ncbi:MAG TPA: hypothetical protein VHO68_08845 [Bacteroidales bacterium]|jgi:hypothetical protein|nr:hypothetical protein [Bacteroidales bacterium]